VAVFSAYALCLMSVAFFENSCQAGKTELPIVPAAGK
jgi:hypothetical protein